MTKLIIKDGVQPPILRLVAALVNAASELDVSVTITAGIDGQHLPNSLHYSLRALDFRTHDLPDAHAFVDAVKRHAGLSCDVILEGQGTPNEHGHIEYDPV